MSAPSCRYNVGMKRNEFFQMVQPLAEKFYGFAYYLLPDELQAEQLVVDGLNAYLLKERKSISNTHIDVSNKKDTQILRRKYFKGILSHMITIGLRRSVQMTEQLRLSRPAEFKGFYELEPKVRLVLGLRYQSQFSVEEIEDIATMPKYEVIEKIHNGRFLLLNQLNQGVSL